MLVSAIPSMKWKKAKELYEAARLQGLEGIIGKKRDSAYAGQRTSLWLKFKIVDELDAVICGWTAPRRSREFFGALVLGLYNGKTRLHRQRGDGLRLRHPEERVRATGETTPAGQLHGRTHQS